MWTYSYNDNIQKKVKHAHIAHKLVFEKYKYLRELNIVILAY